MKKEQKEKLNNALQEVNAPDREKLLDRIEQKKNFSREYESVCEAQRKKKIKTTVSRVAVATVVMSFAVCIVILLSIFFNSVFLSSGKENGGNGNGSTIDGEVYKDYCADWKFVYDNYISFDDVDMTYDQFCEYKEIEKIFALQEGWSVTRMQTTQIEGAYREYRTDGNDKIELTVFTSRIIPGMDARYKTFFENRNKTFVDGRVWYKMSLMFSDVDYQYAYVYYGEDAVYCIYSSCPIDKF